MTTPQTLSSQARSALRSAAHGLRPVVLIGDQGLTAAVLKEIDSALKAHELIKIKAAGHERADRDQMLADICEQLGCSPVHHLGKTLIVYRLGSKATFAVQTGQAKPAPAKRKANEPHTPKKMAALGKKVTKRPRPTKSTGQAESPAGLKAYSAEKTSRPTTRRITRTTTKSPARPAKKSALTLRAGLRRRKD